MTGIGVPVRANLAIVVTTIAHWPTRQIGTKMTRSRQAIKLLGLCVMALSAMAFAASSAQAVQEKPEWMVEGQNINLVEHSTLLPELQISSIENGTASLLTTVLGAAIEILCTEAHLVGWKLTTHGLTDHGRVDFLHCVTYLEGSTEASEACEPYTEEGGVKSPGLILTNKILGHLRLHTGGVRTIVLEPAALSGESATELVNIKLGPEGECGFSESIPIEGKIVLEDCEGKGEVEQVVHLIKESTHLHLLESLGAAMAIDGSANVVLAGAHAGLKWSGLWD